MLLLSVKAENKLEYIQDPEEFSGNTQMFSSTDESLKNKRCMLLLRDGLLVTLHIQRGFWNLFIGLTLLLLFRLFWF